MWQEGKVALSNKRNVASTPTPPLCSLCMFMVFMTTGFVGGYNALETQIQSKFLQNFYPVVPSLVLHLLEIILLCVYRYMWTIWKEAKGIKSGHQKHNIWHCRSLQFYWWPCRHERLGVCLSLSLSLLNEALKTLETW